MKAEVLYVFLIKACQNSYRKYLQAVLLFNSGFQNIVIPMHGSKVYASAFKLANSSADSFGDIEEFKVNENFFSFSLSHWISS